MERSAFSLRSAARERGAAPAIITATSVITFADLWQRARAVAGELAAMTDRSRPVAVVAPLRIETLLAIHALVALGIPLVPIHPRLTAAERRVVLELSGATTMLDETWAPSAPSVSPSGSRGSAGVDREDDEPSPLADDEAPLAILFTSGSSGAPKGVELSRRAFAAAARASAANLRWEPADRWLLCMPLGHVGGLSVVLRCLEAQVPIVVSPWTGSVAALLADVEALEVTLLSLVPTMLARIFEEAPAYRFPARVRAVLLGGDAASASLLATAAARNVPVVTTYGMTETCSQISTSTPGESPSVDAGSGRPLPGTEVRIEGGVIQVRGPTLFTRYVPAERHPTPFAEDGWFATGDLGRIDAAGRLHVTGRRSDLVITGGENVDPREVELALESCAGVSAACVFAIPDETWGELVGAAIVLAQGGSTTIASVSREVRTRLARHKWPRRIAVTAAFVHNATGKLDRRATGASVREQLTDPG
jgi:O-succinylbenzoic acid--CoA ligase